MPAPLPEEALTRAQLAGIADQPGLYSRHRDVAMVCEQRPQPEHEFPECDVAIVDQTGASRMLGLDDVRNVQRLAGDHLLIVRRSLEMVVTDDDGNELRSLGDAFISPHVSDDGLRVLALAYPPGTTASSADTVRTIDRLHAFTGERETLVDDRRAYAPYEVPGSEDIVFISGRSGLASFWLREADGTELQLTNRAAGRVTDQGWAPVPVHELTWLPDDPDRALYGSRLDGLEELWVLDLRRGRADRVGPGYLPARGADGRLLAVVPNKSGSRVVELTEEVLP